MQTYTKHLGFKNVSRSGSSSVKSHLKYIEQRKNEQGEREKRELYNNENKVNRIDFYKQMDSIERRGVLAHKLVISMDKNTNKEQNIDLKELTRRTINQYEQKHSIKLNWIACNHEGKNPHAHIIVLGQDSNNKNVYIMPKHLKQLKRIADKERERMYKRNIERMRLEQNRNVNKNLDKSLNKNQKLDLKNNKNLTNDKLKNLSKQEKKLIKEIDQVKLLKDKLKSPTSKAYKDLEKQEKDLEKNLDGVKDDIKTEKELNRTFDEIEKQLDHELKLEQNLKPEATQNLVKTLVKALEKTVEPERELIRERYRGR